MSVARLFVKRIRRSGDKLNWWPDAIDSERCSLLAAAWEAVTADLAAFETPGFGETLALLKTESRAAVEVARKDMREAEEAVASQQAVKSADKTDARRKGTLNGLMLAEMAKNPDCWGWTVRKWAAFTGYGKSSVSGTEAWQTLNKGKQLEQAQRALDRRRN